MLDTHTTAVASKAKNVRNDSILRRGADPERLSSAL